MEPAKAPQSIKTRTLRVPDIAWIEIPAGEFIYGAGKQQTTRSLDRFWISKYPVTNLQFQTFIDDGGYREKRWWRDLSKPEPDAPRWSQPNRPRTNVDWYEAVAFTRWLSLRLGLEEGTVRLPTEYEWEKAARGEKGLAYPWGEKYRSGFANFNETANKDGPWYLKQTTAVGLYPHGHSPYEVEDLSGTVWEWCLNKVDEPESIEADTSNTPRALRGGSWVSAPVDARAASGVRNHPVYQLNGRGFRVLSSVPIAVR